MHTANAVAAALNDYTGADYVADIINAVGNQIDHECSEALHDADPSTEHGAGEVWICDDGDAVQISGGRWVAVSGLEIWGPLLKRIARDVTGASDLDDLKEALERAESLTNTLLYHGPDVLNLSIYDVTDLPTFGGEEVDDEYDDVFSWDEERLLVYVGDGEWSIENR